MLKLALMLSAASITASLPTGMSKDNSPKHYFYDTEETNGGYYFVYENPEENQYSDENYNHKTHRTEGYATSGAASSYDGDKKIRYEYSEQRKSYENPRIEYIFVHSNEGDNDHRSDNVHFKEENNFDYSVYPKYKYVYRVQDKHTGDVKSHEESRDGDEVKGWYSVHEPDGTILEVHYTADEKTGFNARVIRKGKAIS